jgi:hypothetical protein
VVNEVIKSPDLASSYQDRGTSVRLVRELAYPYYFMKNILTLTCFLLCALKLSGAFGQNNFDKDIIKTSLSTYNVSTDGKGVVVKNEKNRIVKPVPNYNIQQLSSSGIDINKFYSEVISSLKTSLNDRQKIMFKSGGNILIGFLIQNDGKVEDLVFYLPKNSPLTVSEIEVIEKVVGKTKINFKDPSKYASVNFIPYNIVLRSKDL